jgi:hypothetical protein
MPELSDAPLSLATMRHLLDRETRLGVMIISVRGELLRHVRIAHRDTLVESAIILGADLSPLTRNLGPS